jgi:hypothetical protein
MNIQDFINKFKNDKVTNNKINPNAVSDYLKKELEIKTYIPFRDKREIAEMLVAQNIDFVDGIKKHDAINGYIGFVVAMLTAHTALEFGADPVADYDLLAESGLLPQIIDEFRTSYNECEVILKMALASEMEDNNINVLIGRFLDNLSKKIDDVGEALKGNMGNLNLTDLLGADFKKEDLTKLKGFLNIYNNKI